MADDRGAEPVPAHSLTCTVSTHPALVDAAEAVTARMAEIAGCGEAEARGLGEAVRYALAGVAGRTEADGRPRAIDVSLAGTDRLVRVDVSCPLPAATGGFSLEQVLAEGGPAGAMRALVDRVEFGKDATRQYCRLTRQIKRPR